MQLLPSTPYHFTEGGIKIIEEKYNAKYLGYWTTKRKNGSWNTKPVDVFYQPNPDLEAGHSHYFGMFVQNEQVFICDAKSAFEEPIAGILYGDGSVLVSRSVHDYREYGGMFIDGGREYTRYGGSDLSGIKFVNVTVQGGVFCFESTGE